MSDRTDTSDTAAMIDLPSGWEAVDTTSADEKVRYEWHRAGGTLVSVWIVERDEPNEASDFRLRVATHDPESLIESNAYEVCQYGSADSAVESAGEFVEYLTERLDSGLEKERPLHVRVANTISAFQQCGDGEWIIGALRRWITDDVLTAP